jgi:hypothetical protein
MSKVIGLCRRRLILGVACGLAMIALAGQSARAGNVTIIVNEAGTAGPVMIFLGSGLEGAGATSNNVTADVAAVNAALDAAGYDFHFNALGAIANSPAAGIAATLLLTGQVFRMTGGSDKTITIDATQNDYTSLNVQGGIMTNFSTANFFPNGGVSQVGTSYFASSNVQDDTTGPSSTVPTFTPPGNHGSGPPVNVPKTAVFSLTNRLVITLTGDTSGGLNPPTDQFTHSTTVTAVPEPTSAAMLSMGMPVAFMGLMWLRRRRATA